MALKIKEVHPSVVGQSGNRNAFAIYDGSSLVYKTKRGGGQGAPMYGLSRTKADFLLAREQARRAGGGKAPKATRASASTPRPTRQKLDRQELTVTGCTNFLRAEGYTVGKKRGSSRKKAKTIDEMLEDGDISFMEAVAMGYETNPRRRRKNPLEEWTYVFIHPLGEMQDVVMASSEADARKKAKAELEKMRRDGEHVSADNLLYVEQAAWHPEDGDYDYSLEAYGRNNPRKRKNPRRNGGHRVPVRGRKDLNRKGLDSSEYAYARPTAKEAEAFLRRRGLTNIQKLGTNTISETLFGNSRPEMRSPPAQIPVWTFLAYDGDEDTTGEYHVFLEQVAPYKGRGKMEPPHITFLMEFDALERFNPREREIRQRGKTKPKAVKGRSSWQQYLRLMKGKGYSMVELRVGYLQLKEKYPNNTKQLLAAARKLPSLKEIVKRKNPRAMRRLR